MLGKRPPDRMGTFRSEALAEPVSGSQMAALPERWLYPERAGSPALVFDIVDWKEKRRRRWSGGEFILANGLLTVTAVS